MQGKTISSWAWAAREFDGAAAFASEDTKRSQPLLSGHIGAQAQTCEEALPRDRSVPKQARESAIVACICSF